MEAINALITRAGVLLGSAVTYITLAMGVITAVVTQLDIPQATEVGGVALTFLAGVIVIIRRVSPVAPNERGML